MLGHEGTVAYEPLRGREQRKPPARWAEQTNASGPGIITTQAIGLLAVLYPVVPRWTRRQIGRSKPTHWNKSQRQQLNMWQRRRSHVPLGVAAALAQRFSLELKARGDQHEARATTLTC